MRTTSFRQSCIDGPRQLGVEDQGWVAWFIIAAVAHLPITICGDGRQVRNVLHGDDLLRAYEAAISRQEHVTGRAFNIGDGPRNTLSLRELLTALHRQLNVDLQISYGDPRPGGQPVFVCDIRLATSSLGGEPSIDPDKGVRSLCEWVGSNKAMFKEVKVM